MLLVICMIPMPERTKIVDSKASYSIHHTGQFPMDTPTIWPTPHLMIMISQLSNFAVIQCDRFHGALLWQRLVTYHSVNAPTSLQTDVYVASQARALYCPSFTHSGRVIWTTSCSDVTSKGCSSLGSYDFCLNRVLFGHIVTTKGRSNLHSHTAFSDDHFLPDVGWNIPPWVRLLRHVATSTRRLQRKKLIFMKRPFVARRVAEWVGSSKHPCLVTRGGFHGRVCCLIVHRNAATWSRGLGANVKDTWPSWFSLDFRGLDDVPWRRPETYFEQKRPKKVQH